MEFFVEDPAEGMSVKLFSKSQKIAITENLIFELENLGFDFILVIKPKIIEKGNSRYERKDGFL